MTPRVTVAFPTYNGARFLREALSSILGQTHRDATVLCIDDASDDDSAAIATSLGIRVVRNEQRLGLAANWNRALDLCETELLVIAHQDDLYAPQFLERMIDVLDRHPDAFAAHCRSLAIDEHGHEIADPAARFKESFWPRGERECETQLAALRRGNFIIAPSVMLRLPARHGAAGSQPAGSTTRGAESPPLHGHLLRFDERYQFVTDWDYWLRGLLNGAPLIGLGERLVSFRRHPETATLASERTMRRYEEELELLSELNARVPAPYPYRALENNLLAGFVRRLGEGDREGARTLLRFGVDRVPGFAPTPRALLMRLALPLGKTGGALLRFAESLFLRIYNRGRWPS